MQISEDILHFLQVTKDEGTGGGFQYFSQEGDLED